MTNSLLRLRLIGLLEGLSYIILLFIAMPLKYYAGYPQAVKFTGMAHGVLFIVFLVCIAESTIRYRWTLGRAVLLFIASLLPFGTFLADVKMLRNSPQG